MDFSSQAYRKLVFDLVILAIRCYKRDENKYTQKQQKTTSNNLTTDQLAGISNLQTKPYCSIIAHA